MFHDLCYQAALRSHSGPRRGQQAESQRLNSPALNYHGNLRPRCPASTGNTEHAQIAVAWGQTGGEGMQPPHLQHVRTKVRSLKRRLFGPVVHVHVPAKVKHRDKSSPWKCGAQTFTAAQSTRWATIRWSTALTAVLTPSHC